MISIIIPSYNSASTIEKCLDALFNQTYSGPYEVILADSSEDNTQKIVRKEFPQVTIISFDTKTDPGTARNEAIKKSSGELLLLIDSDCVAEPDWIEWMVQSHRDEKYAAVGGSVLNGNDPRNRVAWAGYIAEFREFLPGYPLQEVDHIPTCNISYKRRVFKDKQFDPKFYPQEDLYFNYQLRTSGQNILFNPAVRVRHYHRETFLAFAHHQNKIGEITARVLQVLPLPGAFIARNKLLALVSFWILPLVKFIRTIIAFKKYAPGFLLKHMFSLVIFGLGLIPWCLGFIRGVFKKNYLGSIQRN